MPNSDRSNVRVLRQDEWEVWKDLRLAALADSPDAFGELLENAQRRSDDGWKQMAADAGLVDRRSLIAECDGRPAGMAVVIRAEDDPSHANLYAMWVSPLARSRGVGWALLETALGWARDCGIEDVTLNVTEGNVPARRLYLRSGFVPTGRREPLRPGSSIWTEVMVLRLRNEPVDAIDLPGSV